MPDFYNTPIIKKRSLSWAPLMTTIYFGSSTSRIAADATPLMRLLHQIPLPEVWRERAVQDIGTVC